MIRGTSSAGRVNIYELAKVLLIGCMEEIVCNEDDLILDALFKIKPLERLEYWVM